MNPIDWIILAVTMIKTASQKIVHEDEYFVDQSHALRHERPGHRVLRRRLSALFESRYDGASINEMAPRAWRVLPDGLIASGRRATNVIAKGHHHDA